MDIIKLYPDLQEVIAYHTHLCIGIVIGYKACKYAVELIGNSADMQVVASSTGCWNDAVKVLLNCTPEKGNLLIRHEEGISWGVYNYADDEGIRLRLRSSFRGQLSADKEVAIQEILNLPGHVLFSIEPFVPTVDRGII